MSSAEGTAPPFEPGGEKPHVVIAGGGPAAVEALIGLRALAGHRVTIELVAPDPDFVYRPLAVAEPFERGEATRIPLADIAGDHDAGLTVDALASVDVAGRSVTTRGGSEIAYDALLVATGAAARDALPGALSFGGPASVAGFRDILDELRSGAAESLAFVLVPGSTWPIALYDLAMLTATDLREAGVGTAKLTLVTHEAEPLELIGGVGSERVKRLLAESGIGLVTSTVATGVEQGRLALRGAYAIAVDHVVTLPRAEGRRVAGLPSDPDGFIPVDAHGRVRGAADVYAAGDGTNFRVKQGGLAAQQADAVAGHIAARAGAAWTPEPFVPVIRATLLTGSLALHLRRLSTEQGEAAERALWWPPGKIAGRYLAPYLTAHPLPGESPPPMADRSGVADDAPDDDRQAAIDMALALADEEADRGATARALEWLDTAEGLSGLLPREYADKRRRWSQVAT